jgi:hypothetical protein
MALTRTTSRQAKSNRTREPRSPVARRLLRPSAAGFAKLVSLSEDDVEAILEAAGYEADTRDQRAAKLIERVCLALGRALLVDEQIDHGPSPARLRDETDRLIKVLEQAAAELSNTAHPAHRGPLIPTWHAAKEAIEALIGQLELRRRAWEQQPSRHRPTGSAARSAALELASIWREYRHDSQHPLSQREQRRQARDFLATCLDVLGLNLSFRSLCAIVRRVIG